LVAYAAWQPHPGRLEPREVTGWPAIALPLAAPALAAAIQVYGFFHEIPRAERALTLVVLVIAMVQIVVLVIAMVQIVVTRPRRRSADRGPT
jgi:heme/copper-type cytochrome/quinol oxidase subunit 2